MIVPEPKISVVIATFNSAKFINSAIDSVLLQTFGDFELVIIDDGSVDNTGDIVGSYTDARIRYFYQENKSLPVARNNGVARSSGEYLTFLDADDTFLPEKLEIQFRVLERRQGIGLLASGYEFVDEGGNVINQVKPWEGRAEINLWTLLTGGLTATHAVLIRREKFEKVGGFDPAFLQAPDMDLWFRLALAGCPMIWEPAIVCQYRVHGSNLTRNPSRHFRRYFAALDKVFISDELPASIRTRKGEIYALGHLSAASRLLMVDQATEALENVRSAFVMDPGLLMNKCKRLAEAVAGLQEDVWIKDPFALRDIILGELDKTQSPAFLRTLQIVNDKRQFYKAFTSGKKTEIRRTWSQIVRHEPGWLLNRGGWSILCQSLVGYYD